MSEEESSSDHPWKGVDFFTPLLLFFIFGGVASTYADRTESLNVSGAGLAHATPYLMFAVLLLLPPLLMATPLTKWRQGVTLAAAFLCMWFPALLFSCATIATTFGRPVDDEERTKIREELSIPMLFDSAGREGDCVYVRRGDYTASVKAYLRSARASIPKHDEGH